MVLGDCTKGLQPVDYVAQDMATSEGCVEKRVEPARLRVGLVSWCLGKDSPLSPWFALVPGLAGWSLKNPTTSRGDSSWFLPFYVPYPS